VVGSGLAGGSAAATLGELGYRVKCFCYQDSPRRAHSIAAQGGINAAKNYQNDGDSVFRLFYDTIKGGDFRSREATFTALAEVSNLIIDQCTEQGVPFAREYGGLLAIVPLADPRFHGPFTRAGKPVSNSCSALTSRYAARSRLAPSKCFHKWKCLISFW
jgi:Succinate dehydrogenase/fumarate reductase, flavoprotein subunit